MLFQSRTAQVSVFQGEDELTGVRAGHGGYDFTIAVQPGDLTVRFINTTGDTVTASLDDSDLNFAVAPGATHDFNLTVSADKAVHLSWGDRSAMLRFRA